MSACAVCAGRYLQEVSCHVGLCSLHRHIPTSSIVPFQPAQSAKAHTYKQYRPMSACTVCKGTYLQVVSSHVNLRNLQRHIPTSSIVPCQLAQSAKAHTYKQYRPMSACTVCKGTYLQAVSSHVRLSSLHRHIPTGSIFPCRPFQTVRACS